MFFLSKSTSNVGGCIDAILSFLSLDILYFLPAITMYCATKIENALTS
jgi:hypothetical protein